MWHLFKVIWSLRCSSHIIRSSPCCADSTVHRLCWELKSWLGFARTKVRSYNIFLTHCEKALSKTSSPGASGSGRARGTWKMYGHEQAFRTRNYSRAPSSAALRASPGHCSRIKGSLYHLYQAGYTFTLPDQSEMVLGHRELECKALATIITK